MSGQSRLRTHQGGRTWEASMQLRQEPGGGDVLVENDERLESKQTIDEAVIRQAAQLVDEDLGVIGIAFAETLARMLQ